MGRKRLLTILAGVIAAVGLHMGPAVALDLERDLGVTEVEASIDEDGVEARVGDDEDEGRAKVSEDEGADAKAGDTEVSTKDAEKPGEESDPDDGSDETDSTGERSSSSGSNDDSSTSSRGSSSDNDVAAAGGAGGVQPAERPDALRPEEARRFLASSRDPVDISGPRGDVTPAFDLSGASDVGLDDPQVAAPGAPGGASESEWQAASPETAPPRSDAELAAIPAPSPSEVPAGLKLMAGLLVAGTGTLWHLTRRELQPVRS